MATEIIVVSGFLGAGKTTFIQKLLNEALQNKRVVLIENDFGDISVDAALLQSGGIHVKEMKAGCICCSLSGDFVKALKELLASLRPDVIVIEPSGVGKLSDVMKACVHSQIQPHARLAACITVVDVKRCGMYLDNFGEFFEDQIQNADTVLLRRAEDFPEKLDGAQRIVRELNPKAAVFAAPWPQLNAADLLRPRANADEAGHKHACGCGHAHDHDGGCCEHHAAEDVFETVTIRTGHVFDAEDLKSRLLRMERFSGTVLRAKGIVSGPDGYLNVQYLPGDVKITDCAVGGDVLCVIGRGLNRRELYTLFDGK